MARPAALQRHAELVPQLVDSLATPAFCVGRGGTITGWNDAISQLLGHRRGQAVGRRCWRVLRGRDEAGEPLCSAGCKKLQAEIRGEGTSPPFVMEVPRADGTRRWVECATVSLARRPRNGSAVLYQLRVAPNRPQDRTTRNKPALTPREAQTLRLLCEGLGGEALASRLGVRNVTARNHVQNLLRKLGVHSRLQAVARARSWGLL